ncbi:hypothetical protein SAMN05660653_01474 [Desulfonatronum thiosulfatophilum]|uniref:CoA-binding domain-containing protein n=1 Tax=Desulfonatronum thiosulfatophilum TaxID=617002 RepID=A0A1G6CCB4_9BACT|nr:CoA-binding protein [Desulfonatronum thiosulfatophilum]SDB30401.1 hypothetical protein SAMN05660653_01474 [Desulfonatronum thiosulfatophilum]
MLHLSELAARLAQVKTIAVVGAKDVPGRPVDRVGRYLIGRGFKIFPVHPVRRDVWGLPTYARLIDIPEPIDLVDVFRAPQFCAEHAREVLELNPLPAIFWMQSGISNAEARTLLQAAGVFVVEDLCLMIEHQHL